MSSDADAIIIGAGHNGLSCGIMLARKGWDVLVLEKNDQPGGACKTAEITEPGFKHDLYATNIGLFLDSPVYEEVGDEMHEHGFDIALSDHPFGSVYPDGDGISVYTDPEKNRSSFERYSEADADAWEEMVEYFNEVAPHLFPVLQMPVPSMKAGKHVYSTVREYGFDNTMELLSMLLKTPRQFTDDWFEHEKVKSLLIPWGFHLDYGPDVSGGAMFPFLESVANHLNGMPMAAGGAQNLIDGLVHVLEAEGGTLSLNEPVSEVTVRDGEAVGVKTAEGHEYTADQAVIGNVNPTVLYEGLVDSEHLSDSFMKKVRNYRYGPGTVMMHFALNDTIDWKAGEEFTTSNYVHIAPYVDDVARTYQQVMAGLIPDSPLLVAGQPTVADPSRAPEGKHILWLQVRAVPPEIEGDAAGEIDATTWDEAIGPFEERVLDKLETYAPGIRENIIDYTTLSPADLESDNPNLIGGDSVAGSHHLDQHWVFRPFPSWSSYSTPVDQLYMCGASTWPGGGLNATSGYLAAQELTTGRMSGLWDIISG